jgi:hypothetical protein
LEKKSICRRDELSKLDFSTLRCVEKQDAFVRAVQRVIAAPLSSQDSQMPQNSYSVVASAIKIASHKILPLKSKPQPDWFEAKKSELLSIISARNAALDSHHRHPSLETAERWRTVRKKLKTALRAAKSDWILGKCKGLNDSITSTHGTKTSWDTVKELRDGLLGRSRRLPPAKMKLADGSLGTTAEENATVFATHFETLYGINSPHDESVVELLRQRDVAEDLDHPPTQVEVRAALGKLRNTSPGESGIPALAWKALGLTDESLSLVMAFVIDFWEAEPEEMAPEWETGLLKILPKKGDRSLPGNYRGIMLLEVAYKIIANILFTRLTPIVESPKHVDHEPQCGFCSERGCPDASFTVNQATDQEAP